MIVPFRRRIVRPSPAALQARALRIADQLQARRTPQDDGSSYDDGGGYDDDGSNVGEQVNTNLERWHPDSIAEREAAQPGQGFGLERFYDRREGRSLPQPMMPAEMPHNEANPDDPHRNGMFGFDDPEGETVLPPPCWDQYPDGPDGTGNVKRSRGYNPTTAYGDRSVFILTRSTKEASGQLLDLRYTRPAATLIRLSSTEISGILAAPDLLLFVTWIVDYGVGRATQQKRINKL